MSDAAYAAVSGQDNPGANSKERINNDLAKKAERYPGLAEDIAKYEVAKSNLNMFSAVNHADKTVIVSFKGTSRGVDVLHDVYNVARGD